MNDPTREFLNSVRDAKFNINRCRRKIEELRSECERVTAVMSGAPGGGGDSHKDGMWASLADYCTELSDLYKESVRREQEVQAFISDLENSEQRVVLTLRYVDLLKWDDVMDEMERINMPCSSTQVFRVHGAALESARKLWAEKHMGESEV